MLGLADRSKLILLFKEMLKGNQKEAINSLRELIDSGLDAKNFLNDILEMISLRNKAREDKNYERENLNSLILELIDQYSKNLDTQDLGIFWQLTINFPCGHENENLTLEMYIMQLIHLKNIASELKIENKYKIRYFANQNRSRKKFR